jgi:membrane fusion protein (multidrug efflux system)
MLLDIDLQHERRRGLVVPEEALIHFQREHYVLLVDTDDGNRLVRRNVELGVRAPGTVEVRNGLAAGDLVVVEGSSGARPGQQVTIRERAAAGQAG